MQARNASRGHNRPRSKRSDSNAGLPFFGSENVHQIESGLVKEIVNSSLLPTVQENRSDLVIQRMMTFNQNIEDSVGLQNSPGKGQ